LLYSHPSPTELLLLSLHDALPISSFWWVIHSYCYPHYGLERSFRSMVRLLVLEKRFRILNNCTYVSGYLSSRSYRSNTLLSKWAKRKMKCKLVKGLEKLRIFFIEKVLGTF